VRGLSLGARYMIGSALGFSFMSIFVKLAGERLPSQELVVARSVVALVLAWFFLRRKRISPWGTQRRLLVFRGLLGFCGLSCFYYALTQMPLAEATVIQYMHPVFTALLALVFLRERIGGTLVASLALGFGGVLLVAKPEFLFGGGASAIAPQVAGIALLGSLFSAAAYTVIRRLSAKEDPLVIIFYFPLVAVPLSIPPLIPVALWPTPYEWLLLLAVGVTTFIGQVCLTRGLALLPAGRATSISTTQILFATLLGVTFFGEAPDLLSIGGGLLILLGTWFAAKR